MKEGYSPVPREEESGSSFQVLEQHTEENSPERGFIDIMQSVIAGASARTEYSTGHVLAVFSFKNAARKEKIEIIVTDVDPIAITLTFHSCTCSVSP